mmetsp:Transcript_10394/g.18700  ORF Transcript_10394/g.18700 Transcript_10394/m.18700 type:complete len:205 (+) Transcript_10394:336-950(+)
MGENYYDILAVPKDASEDEHKKAYKKMAVRWHPDRHVSKTEAEQKEAEEKFKKMAEAYDVLSDDETRKVYDRYGEEGLKGGGCPPPPEEDANQGFSQHFRPGGGNGNGDGGSSGNPFGAGEFPGGGGGGSGAGYTYAGDPSEFFANFTRATNQRQRSYGETPFDGPGGLEEMLFGGGSDAYHGGSKRHRPSHVPERCCSLFRAR